ncbi:WD40-repeat-containing domain protein [Tribonema minus]|uniref:WD40-repeat-containing domain protein n=1 Tax=Tribonema minus TaxID=303371 RepID=A0A835YH66_9STRA|nr:WD40-repeat-containing domain protein [Tribonema minus]
MAGTGCLICFDPLQGQLLAILSADNRLRLWDVVSGTVRQQYVEAQHLSKHFSAIAWHRPSSASAGKRRRSSSTDSAAPLGVIALGSEAGGVSIWDLQLGVQTTLTDGNARSPISCMAFSSDGSKLYTASSTDKDVVEWSMESSKILRKLK